jgi:hypothetical protein
MLRQQREKELKAVRSLACRQSSGASFHILYLGCWSVYDMHVARFYYGWKKSMASLSNQVQTRAPVSGADEGYFLVSYKLNDQEFLYISALSSLSTQYLSTL